MRYGASRGSHLPVLIKLVEMTDGPILELGTGFCSTPFLHWACYPRRKLVSYENNPEYFDFARSFRKDFHHVYCVDDYDDVDLESHRYNIAFLDHSPGSRRGKDILRLKNADYIVIHDSENSNARAYGLTQVFNKFRYRYKYNDAYPFTSVWSNRFDLGDFIV